jgi:hypothetical protein
MLRKHRESEGWIAVGLGLSLMALPLAAEKNMTLRLSCKSLDLIGRY